VAKFRAEEPAAEGGPRASSGSHVCTCVDSASAPAAIFRPDCLPACLPAGLNEVPVTILPTTAALLRACLAPGKRTLCFWTKAMHACHNCKSIELYDKLMYNDGPRTPSTDKSPTIYERMTAAPPFSYSAAANPSSSVITDTSPHLFIACQ